MQYRLLYLTLDLLCRMRADSSLLDSPITPAWSLASHHSTSLSTSFSLVPSWSAASTTPTHNSRVYWHSPLEPQTRHTHFSTTCCVQRQKSQIDSLPCVSMSIRNVPRSLNCTGGISDCRNFNTTSATPADSILDLFTTGDQNQSSLKTSLKLSPGILQQRHVGDQDLHTF